MSLSRSPKALLLSGYHALSQAQWAHSLPSMCPHLSWQTLALPPRYFSWRMRGAPLSFSALNDPALHAHTHLLVATSSVDLSVVQSLYPNLRNVPSLLYFHENQFAYPKAHTPQSVVDWQMVNLYSALRADSIVFNSQYNRDSFFSGVKALCRKLPDLIPDDLLNTLEGKTDIIPVPVKIPDQMPDRTAGPLTILWNHRWEWDKQPELLEAVIKLCHQQAFPVRFIITGQQFRKEPAAFTNIRSKHSPCLSHIGFIEGERDYQNAIAQCDVILSTAIHEFQGIAVMEAVARGCTPLLPDALSYPEFFSEDYRYPMTQSIDDTAALITARLSDWQVHGRPPAPDMSAYSSQALAPRYTEKLNALLNRTERPKAG